jgi:hypothetical protein
MKLGDKEKTASVVESPQSNFFSNPFASLTAGVVSATSVAWSSLSRLNPFGKESSTPQLMGSLKKSSDTYSLTITKQNTPEFAQMVRKLKRQSKKTTDHENNTITFTFRNNKWDKIRNTLTHYFPSLQIKGDNLHEASHTKPAEAASSPQPVSPKELESVLLPEGDPILVEEVKDGPSFDESQALHLEELKEKMPVANPETDDDTYIPDVSTWHDRHITPTQPRECEPPISDVPVYLEQPENEMETVLHAKERFVEQVALRTLTPTSVTEPKIDIVYEESSHTFSMRISNLDHSELVQKEYLPTIKKQIVELLSSIPSALMEIVSTDDEIIINCQMGRLSRKDVADFIHFIFNLKTVFVPQDLDVAIKNQIRALYLLSLEKTLTISSREELLTWLQTVAIPSLNKLCLGKESTDPFLNDPYSNMTRQETQDAFLVLQLYPEKLSFPLLKIDWERVPDAYFSLAITTRGSKKPPRISTTAYVTPEENEQKFRDWKPFDPTKHLPPKPLIVSPLREPSLYDSDSEGQSPSSDDISTASSSSFLSADSGEAAAAMTLSHSPSNPSSLAVVPLYDRSNIVDIESQDLTRWAETKVIARNVATKTTEAFTTVVQCVEAIPSGLTQLAKQIDHKVATKTTEAFTTVVQCVEAIPSGLTQLAKQIDHKVEEISDTPISIPDNEVLSTALDVTKSVAESAATAVVHVTKGALHGVAQAYDALKHQEPTHPEDIHIPLPNAAANPEVIPKFDALIAEIQLLPDVTIENMPNEVVIRYNFDSLLPQQLYKLNQILTDLHDLAGTWMLPGSQYLMDIIGSIRWLTRRTRDQLPALEQRIGEAASALAQPSFPLPILLSEAQRQEIRTLYNGHLPHEVILLHAPNPENLQQLEGIAAIEAMPQLLNENNQQRLLEILRINYNFSGKSLHIQFSEDLQVITLSEVDPLFLVQDPSSLKDEIGAIPASLTFPMSLKDAIQLKFHIPSHALAQERFTVQREAVIDVNNRSINSLAEYNALQHISPQNPVDFRPLTDQELQQILPKAQLITRACILHSILFYGTVLPYETILQIVKETEDHPQLSLYTLFKQRFLSDSLWDTIKGWLGWILYQIIAIATPQKRFEEVLNHNIHLTRTIFGDRTPLGLQQQANILTPILQHLVPFFENYQKTLVHFPEGAQGNETLSEYLERMPTTPEGQRQLSTLIDNYPQNRLNAQESLGQYLQRNMPAKRVIDQQKAELYSKFNAAILKAVLPKIIYKTELLDRVNNWAHAPQRFKVTKYTTIALAIIGDFILNAFWLCQQIITKIIVRITLQHIIDTPKLLENFKQLITRDPQYRHNINVLLLNSLKALEGKLDNPESLQPNDPALEAQPADPALQVSRGISLECTKAICKAIPSICAVMSKEDRQEIQQLLQNGAQPEGIVENIFRIAVRSENDPLNQIINSVITQALPQILVDSMKLLPESMEQLLYTTLHNVKENILLPENARTPLFDNPALVETDRHNTAIELENTLKRVVEKSVRRAVGDQAEQHWWSYLFATPAAESAAAITPHRINRDLVKGGMNMLNSFPLYEGLIHAAMEAVVHSDNEGTLRSLVNQFLPDRNHLRQQVNRIVAAIRV